MRSSRLVIGAWSASGPRCLRFAWNPDSAEGDETVLPWPGIIWRNPGGSGDPGDVFALETVAFSLAKVSAVLGWRTVWRGQGSGEIDQKLDWGPVKSRPPPGALWDQWLAWVHNSGVGVGFLPLLMPTAARHPPPPPGYQELGRCLGKQAPRVRIVEPVKYFHFAKPIAPPRHSKITISI